MDYYIHKASGFTVNQLSEHGINHLIKVASNSVFDGKLVERLVVSPVRFKPYKAWVDWSTKLVTILSQKYKIDK